jgi:hypothetical protein
MRKSLATEGWWMGTMSLLIVSNISLVYWVLAETLGWQNGYGFGDFLYYMTFFPGMFLAPAAAILGFYVAIDFIRVGQWGRSAVLAFLTGGAGMCAWIAWGAHLSAGRA